MSGDRQRAGQADGPVAGERFAHEALAVVLQVREERLCVLLWQRAEGPFRGLWALPGGPLGGGERLGTSASRHLAAKVDLTDIAYLEQLETRSDPGRDPRGRVLATAYLALVTAGLEPRVPADTAWHPVQDLPPTAFDHGSIAGSGRARLRAKLSYTNIGFALASETFTIAQLRDIYAASLGYPVSATNLQRVLTRRGVIEATEAAARPTHVGGRPAALYRFAARTLVVTHPFAAFRPPALPHLAQDVGPAGTTTEKRPAAPTRMSRCPPGPSGLRSRARGAAPPAAGRPRRTGDPSGCPRRAAPRRNADRRSTPRRARPGRWRPRAGRPGRFACRLGRSAPVMRFRPGSQPRCAGHRRPGLRAFLQQLLNFP